ncbi:glucans biosynthesis glucosyltransferase H [Klebsiella pneumoniae]|uniref:Glucans biosynthesis glucosyltransferase H n=1 Tax=Klebsiella pneumoniae TaxID=573 RepID=A0A447S5E6_KLEPN|nr:glucans biosynthesis glucosyltransferase H [Klebsiella pneumoniae]
MNKITKYIDALPLSDDEKSALPDTSLQAVHQALDDDHQTFAREDDSPLGSVKARLAHSWPDSLSGDQLVKDDEGRTQLHAMPKAKRSSMIPDPWRTNPVGRFWDRLRGRDVTPRYLSRLTQEERESEQKWRTVGTIRRYILLLLTLSQTVVATWYMKTILPYQGWGADQPGRHGGAEPVDLVHAAAAVRVAERHSDPLRGAVLLGFRRLLDRVNGLPAAIDRPR